MNFKKKNLSSTKSSIQIQNTHKTIYVTLGATAVAALTTKPRKDLWLKPPPTEANLTFEVLRPSNDEKPLAGTLTDDAVSCDVAIPVHFR